MTPFEFLTQVKDHVTDTNKTLSDAERTLLRSVSIVYSPPGTNPFMELGDILQGGYHFAQTYSGKRKDDMPGNTGRGTEEIGPIEVFGFAHEKFPPCVLAFTIIHEMAHVLQSAKAPHFFEDTYDGHDEAWAADARRLGIEERAYNENGKDIALYRQCGWPLNKISDPELLAWVESLGPVTDWDRPKHSRVALD